MQPAEWTGGSDLYLRFVTFALLMLSTAAQAQPQTTAHSPMHSVAMQRQSTGTFYLNAAFAGSESFSLLVDTGSSFMVIPQDMLDELLARDEAQFDRHIGARMADESVRKVPIYRIKALRLGESCWLHDVESAVFPSGTRPILGMRALERLAPFQFSIAPAELSLSRCQLMTAGDAQALAMP